MTDLDNEGCALRHSYGFFGLVNHSLSAPCLDPWACSNIGVWHWERKLRFRRPCMKSNTTTGTSDSAVIKSIFSWLLQLSLFWEQIVYIFPYNWDGYSYWFRFLSWWTIEVMQEQLDLIFQTPCKMYRSKNGKRSFCPFTLLHLLSLGSPSLCKRWHPTHSQEHSFQSYTFSVAQDYMTYSPHSKMVWSWVAWDLYKHLTHH